MVPSPSRSSLEKNRSISVLEKLHLNEIVDVTSRISDPGGVVPDPDLTLEKNRIWIRNRIILSRITGSDQQNSPFFSWILKETFILVGFWTWMFRPFKHWSGSKLYTRNRIQAIYPDPEFQFLYFRRMSDTWTWLDDKCRLNDYYVRQIWYKPKYNNREYFSIYKKQEQALFGRH